MGFSDKVNEVLDFKEGFVDKLNELFGKWGLFVYDHPFRVIIISLVVCFVPALGFLPGIARWTDGADNLYALPVSEARNEGIIRDNMFRDAVGRANFLAVTSNPPGHNILRWDTIAMAQELDEMVKGYRVDPTTGYVLSLPANPMYYPEFFADGNLSKVPDRPILRYEDICSPDPATGCRIQSIFEMGIYEYQMLSGPDAPPELYVLDNLVFNSRRKGYYPGVILGGMKKEPCVRELPTALLSQLYDSSRYWEGTQPGHSAANMECITEARSFHFIYELWDKPEFQERIMAWELLFYDMFERNEYYSSLLVGANAFRSRDDELSKSTAESDDIIFVVYTFLLLVAYTTLVHFNCDAYRSKALSSVVGSLSCVLGLIWGLGFPSLCGTAFVPTALVAPFLVMGVGADDIFVFISSYALAYGEDSARQRCAVTLRGCGVSVVMTTVTNVIAFAIGIQSPYLSIRNFCIFTLCGMTFALIYEMTLFYAFLCLDARREEQDKAFYLGLKIHDKSDRSPFDIHKVVSTYQVVHVLVADALKNNVNYGIEPAPSAEKLKQLGFRAKCWEILKFRGNYWYRPISNSGVGSLPGVSRMTSTTEAESDADGERIIGDSESVHSHISASSHISELKKQLTRHVSVREKVDRFALNKKLEHPAYRYEPRGTVGRRGRLLFIKHFAAGLLNPFTKIVVLLIFAANLAIAIYGFTQLTQGLEMKDLSPDGSYLKLYDWMFGTYFPDYDLPIEVFFPEPTDWWDIRAQNSLKRFLDKVNARSENAFYSDPLVRMLQDASLVPSLTSGNATEFQLAVWRHTENPDSAYKQFELDFAWDGHRLLGFRGNLIPSGTTSSQERAHWMLTLRDDCAWARSLPADNETLPIAPYFYNYMLVFYESDITITKNVIAALSTASMAMLVCAFMLIPELVSGLIVILIMFLIDMSIIGYMSFWDVPLNMISMIILVISIGFAVDYSAHICYAFVNAVGQTRNRRVVEAVVLVGTPLFHGAMANMLGIVLLGFSTSYILRIFFKMMVLVVLFGITHGLTLLPVILSIMGRVTGSVLVKEDEVPPEYHRGQQKTVKKTKTILPNTPYDNVNLSIFSRWSGHGSDDEEEQKGMYDEANGSDLESGKEDLGGGKKAQWHHDRLEPKLQPPGSEVRRKAAGRVNFQLPRKLLGGEIGRGNDLNETNHTPLPKRR